jgi:D-psicose/D-tagatose/L-ribulose 3-epimerase
MDISISNIAWDITQDEDIASILRLHGVRFIDIAPGKYFPDLHAATNRQIDTIKAWWLDRGISIAGMQALLFGTDRLNLFGDITVQEEMLSHLTDVCRIGSRLDARLLVFGSPRNRDRSDCNDAEMRSIYQSFFRRLGSIAEDHGVKVCLEPNPRCYGSNFMTNSAETAAVVEDVDHPAIRMQFDTGAVYLNSEDPKSVCQSYGHLIGHIHASEPQLKPVGSSECDHEACALALAQTLPDSIVSIEMLTRDSPDPLTAIEESIIFTRSIYA